MELYQNQEEKVRIKRDRYKLCSNCGNFSHYSEPQRYCMVCGTEFLKECPACREPIIYPTAVFCPACGDKMVKKNNK